MDLTGNLGGAVSGAEKDFVAQFPGLETFIDSQLGKFQATLTTSLQLALTGFADGMSQALQLGYSINGATLSLEIEPIILPAIPAIKAKLTINMPLVPNT